MPRTALLQARKKKGLSQQALAQLLNVPIARISRLELGYYDPTDSEARTLCRVLELAADRIDEGLGRTQKPITVVTQPPQGLGMAAAAALREAREAAGGASSPKEKKVANFATLPEISDPKNFDEWPDESVLKTEGANGEQARQRLLKAVGYTETVLHTSRVPAEVWRRWREFHRQALALLQAVR